MVDDAWSRGRRAVGMRGRRRQLGEVVDALCHGGDFYGGGDAFDERVLWGGEARDWEQGAPYCEGEENADEGEDHVGLVERWV